MPEIILSNHARQRAKLRKIELSAIRQLILYPSNKIDLGENKFKFFKNVSHRRYQAVATHLKNENKWLVISVWVKGEEDQLPLLWLLISLPFRLTWWLIKSLWQIIAKIARKK